MNLIKTQAQLPPGSKVIAGFMCDKERWSTSFLHDEEPRIKILSLFHSATEGTGDVFGQFLEAATRYLELMKLHRLEVDGNRLIDSILRSAYGSLHHQYPHSPEIDQLSNALEEYNPDVVRMLFALSSDRSVLCLIELWSILHSPPVNCPCNSRQGPWSFVYKYIWSNSLAAFKWEMIEGEKQNLEPFNDQQKHLVNAILDKDDWRGSVKYGQELRDCVMGILGNARRHKRSLDEEEEKALFSDLRNLQFLALNQSRESIPLEHRQAHGRFLSGNLRRKRSDSDLDRFKPVKRQLALHIKK